MHGQPTVDAPRILKIKAVVTGGDGLAFTQSAGAATALGIVDLDALISYVQSRPGGVVRGDAAPRIVPVP